jgi:hypothetical protein
VNDDPVAAQLRADVHEIEPIWPCAPAPASMSARADADPAARTGHDATASAAATATGRAKAAATALTTLRRSTTGEPFPLTRRLLSAGLPELTRRRDPVPAYLNQRQTPPASAGVPRPQSINYAGRVLAGRPCRALGACLNLER